MFWVELRATVAPVLFAGDSGSVAPAEPRSPSGAHVRTLLYVEDNPANMELVEQIIARRSDLQLQTAVNGILGFEVARVTRPEVILMDINLPGLSGIEVLKLLRECAATAHIPVVALSANAMPDDIAKGMAAGFYSYLTKPIKVAEFMATLNAALESTENPPRADR
jgi:CheY-like chemotaxis protein